MELTRDEEQFLALYRQCSPMQRMLIIDALQDMLALPGEIDLFSEAQRNECYDCIRDAQACPDETGTQVRGKILPFRRA